METTQAQAIDTVVFYVTYRNAAYSTNRVLGCSASSTMSPEAAAQRLADKLFGTTRGPVEETSEGTYLVRRFSASGVLQDAPRQARGTGKRMKAVAPGQAITGDGSGTKLPPITTQAGQALKGVQLLKAAGYRTGQSGANGQPRCSNCSHCGPSQLRAGKQHGRHCSHHNAPVKTHGHCQAHAPAA
jgi:hypothetical protein